jgi:hypothetical protein
MDVKDAARGWVRAAAAYDVLWGVPSHMTRTIAEIALDAGLSGASVEAEFYAARAEKPTRYMMGWVSRMIEADASSRLLDPQRPQMVLGEGFEKDPEYLRGRADADRASSVLLRVGK